MRDPIQFAHKLDFNGGPFFLIEAATRRFFSAALTCFIMPTILQFHTVEKISFSGNLMILEVDSRRVKFDLHRVSPLLAAASPEQRMHYEVSPSGYGVHWPELDEDLSVDALLGIQHFPKLESVESVADDGASPKHLSPQLTPRPKE